MKTLLVTGSSGLIGSEVCQYFHAQGWRVIGVDNNQRAVFFGPQGDTRWNQERLKSTLDRFEHVELDIRDRLGVIALLANYKPDAIVHTAAQPSHDRAAAIPFDDFDTNAVGTLNMLEAARQACPESPFVHMSTNKVYGDAPNAIKLKELETRWDYADEAYVHGIAETFTIDQSKHSLFGASKVAADVMVQEYGRYFNMPTACYLVKCNLEGKKYNIFGYKGKQVRDNIHSLDVSRFIDAFITAPRIAQVYNLGGGLDNTCSILEAFKITEGITGKAMEYEYVDKNREGDHICYYSDLRKMKEHYPSWDITKNLQTTFEEIVESWEKRQVQA